MEEDERRQVIRKIRRSLREAVNKLREVDALAATLGDGAPREVKRADENGEPTWAYAISVPLPAEVYLTKKWAAYALEQGCTQVETVQMFEDFKLFYRKGGEKKKWQQWTLVWMLWVRTDAKRKADRGTYKGRFDRAGT